MPPAMVLFAATALEKLKEVPSAFWVKVALIIGGFLLTVILLKLAGRANKVILGTIILITVSLVGFSWIYNRNEPAFMTPIINVLAQWFPSKGAYETKQQEDPSKPGIKKNPMPPPNQTPNKSSQTPQKK